MTILDFFWFFFMISAVQPVLHRRFLEYSRQRLLERIEEQRGSRVILMVHRQETMSLLGFPLYRYIDMQDSEEVIRAIHMTDKNVPLDIILHTPGGLVLASTQIARAIHQHPAKVTVIVPHMAMSGGTLIALAADEILMCRHAVLGPVDPQLGQFPAQSLLRARERKPIERIEDQTLILADQAEKAVRQVRTFVFSLLREKLGDSRAQETADRLASGRDWTHDFPITPEFALELGLPVSTDVPEEVLRLMSLYPQPLRQVPTVEYLPVPKRTHPSRTN
ncbi:MAG: hypothetical protein D6679_03735 [Candidatus Hydrogenedentota bacterium]|nr:MAG: hypothetical protein D6679_03735 [Candidatus Hydrogenedentota bacterium]